VQRIQLVPHRPCCRIFVLVTLLTAVALPGFGQRTVVQDAGGGRKIELHYNAAGKITETRTLGPNGQLLQKQILEYRPGAYLPQTTSTFYWPNGKVHRITRDTYDDNGNFTGESIQVFDEAGQQIASHQVTHDPQTNTYHCTDWNATAQAYKPVECPEGEESSGSAETVKKFTRDEVMRQLAEAREAARQPPEAPLAAPSRAVSAGTRGMEVGLVLPTGVRPGERVSGSVVENPRAYEGTPGIAVTRVVLPLTPSGLASPLSAWTVAIPGEPPQPADHPIVLTIPSGHAEIAVLFRQKGSSSSPVSRTISISRASTAKGKRPASYLAPAICLKGQPCVVRGPFGGDSSRTFAAFEKRPARIITETSDTAYIAVPERTELGPRSLVIAEGQKVVAFPMVIAELTITPDRRELSQGDTLLLYATLDGPEELPDPLWRPGNYPAWSLAMARELVPGFQLPKTRREARQQREGASEEGDADEKQATGKQAPEPEEEEGGEILLVVKNLTPSQVTCRESRNESYVLPLNAESFQRGEFQYKFVVEANQSGAFAIQGYVIPFLAPVPGQEFTLSSVSTR